MDTQEEIPLLYKPGPTVSLDVPTVSCVDEDAWQKDPSANTARKCRVFRRNTGCGRLVLLLYGMWARDLQNFNCASEIEPDLPVLNSANAWVVGDFLLKV